MTRASITGDAWFARAASRRVDLNVERAIIRPDWLELLAPVPECEGECTFSRETLPGEDQAFLVLGDGVTGLRLIVAMYDRAGRPTMIDDRIATDVGHFQETAGGRVAPDGRITGAHWLVEGDRLTPRPLTETEERGLLVVAAELLRRCLRESNADP